jgi:cytosine/adenosine deaminase-related metal-dependent hydrolase
MPRDKGDPAMTDAAVPVQPQTTCIRGASWIIGWDPVAGEHVYLRNGDVVWTGDRLIHVGGRYDGPVDVEIRGADRLVMPGLINIHCHPTQTPIFRGFVEEAGNPRLFYGARKDFRQSFLPDAEAQLASARYGLAEMLACGTTSIVDLSHAYPGWLPLLAESGLRAWAAPMYRSARWWTDTGQETKFDWSPDLGQADFHEAMEVMDAAEAHPCGRLSALVSPAQVDTCTEELLVASADLARRKGRPLHTHGAQGYPEFNQMARRNDMTSIEWLHRIGFLGKQTIIGHAVFTDEHPWVHWPHRRDLRLLAETGSSVAHCPTPFARDGTIMHHLGAYMDAGVNIAIGTDTHPQNLFEEMAMADTLARIAAGPRHTSSTARVFHACTIGAARLLGRDDIGRLSPGAKADLVLCDLSEPNMLPMRDPLRNLIYSSGGRSVRDVWVDGRAVVSAGQVMTIDYAQAARDLQDAQDRIGRAIPELDVYSPLALRVASA